MTAQELMKPRFEVIADFPGSPFKIGEIWGTESFIDDPEKYPHLFRKLNWWENRKVEDMPKRLICKAIPNDTEIMEIQEWNMDTLFGFTSVANRIGCSLYSFNPEYGYFPVD